MQVREVMCQDPVCCTKDAKLTEIAKLMAEHDCGAIPIVDDQTSKKLVGIVTDRDIVCRAVAEGKNPLELTAADCMSTSVVTATPEESLEDCCQHMEEKQIRRIPVVDEQGACCGVVAQADVASKASPEEAADFLKKISQPLQSA